VAGGRTEGGRREGGREGGHLLAAGVGIRSAPTTRVRKIPRERRDGERNESAMRARRREMANQRRG
jgi:hypothetical protein